MWFERDLGIYLQHHATGVTGNFPLRCGSKRTLVPCIKRNYTVIMSTLHFDWDPKKAAANQKKHGVSFDEARTVFFDERAKLIDDPDHSESEDRFVLLGLSGTLRVILVCHCYRDEGNVIRIISARKASPYEARQYD